MEKKIIVHSRRYMEQRYVGSVHDAVISIICPDDFPLPELGWGMIHRTSFWDITEPINYRGEKLVPITDFQAKEILRFAESAYRTPSIDRFVIHCAAGISRSPGVAVALAEIYDFEQTVADLINKHPCYNRTVAKTILNQFYNVKD